MKKTYAHINPYSQRQLLKRFFTLNKHRSDSIVCFQDKLETIVRKLLTTGISIPNCFKLAALMNGVHEDGKYTTTVEILDKKEHDLTYEYAVTELANTEAKWQLQNKDQRYIKRNNPQAYYISRTPTYSQHNMTALTRLSTCKYKSKEQLKKELSGKICPHFLKGHCKYGINCFQKHIGENNARNTSYNDNKLTHNNTNNRNNNRYPNNRNQRKNNNKKYNKDQFSNFISDDHKFNVISNTQSEFCHLAMEASTNNVSDDNEYLNALECTDEIIWHT